MNYTEGPRFAGLLFFGIFMVVYKLAGVYP